MMILLLRHTLLLTVLLALPIFAIRAQPYDDSELRAFLAPPTGCPAPCFMGIRPGVTTVRDARMRLEAEPSLANTVGINTPRGLRFRANHPHSLIADSIFSYLETDNNVIQWLRVHTNISLGDVWVTYGPPDWGVRTYTMDSSLIYYTIGYNQADISFEFAVNIEHGQIPLVDIFRERVTLRVGNSMKAYANMNPRLWLYTSRDLSWWHAS